MKLIDGECKLTNIYFKDFMYKRWAILSTLFLALVFGEYDYSLEDINSSSEYYEEYVGPSSFPLQITLHYFGHYN